MPLLPYVNKILALGGAALQILSLLILILLLTKRQNKFLDFIKEHFLIIGFIISLSGVLSSLYYSNVVGFIPCYLCWFQRIFFYPICLLFTVALFKKDKGVYSYIWPFAAIGSIFALYHTYIYYWGEFTAPCDASGVSCVQVLVSELGGYISIPTLSLTSFIAIIVLVLVVRFYPRREGMVQ